MNTPEDVASNLDAIAKASFDSGHLSGEDRWMLNEAAELIRTLTKPEPRPIGTCPKCHTPIYAVEGFCGVCHPEKR